MSADNEKRLEQILSELRPGKRNILQDHINELSGKEREDFIEEVIKEYEAAKNAAQAKASGEDESKTSSLFVLDPDKVPSLQFTGGEDGLHREDEGGGHQLRLPLSAAARLPRRQKIRTLQRGRGISWGAKELLTPTSLY